MGENDLKARIQEEEMRLKKLEFAHAITPLENPMSIRALRKNLARLKTEIQTRKVAGVNTALPAITPVEASN